MQKNMFKPTVISTKANLKWIKVNKEKINILEENGLHMDEIKVIARYIGSCGHDNKHHCYYCGEIFSKKQSKMISRLDYECPKDPKVIEEIRLEEEKNKKIHEVYLLEKKQKQLDMEMIQMIKEKDKKEERKVNEEVKEVLEEIINKIDF